MQRLRGRQFVYSPVCALVASVAGIGHWGSNGANGKVLGQEMKELEMTSGDDGGIQGLGLVMLGVRDVERSVAFYRDRLGLPLQSRSGGFAFFSGNGTTLALSEELGRARDHKAGAVEFVFSVVDVHTAHKMLTQRGVEFHKAPRLVTGDQWSANFTDPDGHELSIFGPSAQVP